MKRSTSSPEVPPESEVVRLPEDSDEIGVGRRYRLLHRPTGFEIWDADEGSEVMTFTEDAEMLAWSRFYELEREESFVQRPMGTVQRLRAAIVGHWEVLAVTGAIVLAAALLMSDLNGGAEAGGSGAGVSRRSAQTQTASVASHPAPHPAVVTTSTPKVKTTQSNKPPAKHTNPGGNNRPPASGSQPTTPPPSSTSGGTTGGSPGGSSGGSPGGSSGGSPGGSSGGSPGGSSGGSPGGSSGGGSAPPPPPPPPDQ